VVILLKMRCLVLPSSLSEPRPLPSLKLNPYKTGRRHVQRCELGYSVGSRAKSHAPNRLHAVHGCGLLLQISHVCVSVCVLSLFFVSVPCASARLSSPYRQLLSARKSTVLYRNGWTDRSRCRSGRCRPVWAQGTIY